MYPRYQRASPASPTISHKQFELDFGAEKDFNEYLKEEAERAPHGDYPGILPCQTKAGGFYPKTDLGVWLRSCINEVEKPLEGKLKGKIPRWICGSLLQNGPGKFYFGDTDVFNHLFDGSALLQKYAIKDGKVSYQCRFLRTESFMKNINAGKILTSEFGTNASQQVENQNKYIPGFINRITKMRELDHIMSDNAMISVYPFGNEHYCFYESPFIQRLDTENLKVIERVNLNKAMGVISHASHPHFEQDGSMLSIGMAVGALGPRYVINKVPVDPSNDDNNMILAELGAPRCFNNVQQVASIASRWKLDPGYMHSFSITENYYIIIEQPLTINLPKLVKSLVSADGAVIDGMFWHGDAPCIFHIIPKDRSKLWAGQRYTFQSDGFFFLHTINAYEKDDHIIIDIACYRNCSMLYLMSVEKLASAQSNKEYSKKFQGRPHRFVIPLDFDSLTEHASSQLNQRKTLPELTSSSDNLITLETSTFGAVAELISPYKIHLTPGKICNFGCETPTINYDAFNGRPYRYFYAVCADVDDPECSGKIQKIDLLTGKGVSWMQENVYCAEAQFVPRPKRYPSEILEEDDGIILTSVIKGDPDVKYAGLIVLNAKNMKELGRAEFTLDGPAPKPLHGCFSPYKGMNYESIQQYERNRNDSGKDSSSNSSESSLFELGSSDLFTSTDPSSTSDDSDGRNFKSDSYKSSDSSEIFKTKRR